MVEAAGVEPDHATIILDIWHEDVPVREAYPLPFGCGLLELKRMALLGKDNRD